MIRLLYLRARVPFRSVIFFSLVSIPGRVNPGKSGPSSVTAHEVVPGCRVSTSEIFSCKPGLSFHLQVGLTRLLGYISLLVNRPIKLRAKNSLS